MKTKKTASEEVDVCFVCEGIWFDTEELERILKDDCYNFSEHDLDQGFYDAAEVADSKINFDAKRGNCPRCDKLMEQKIYKDKVPVYIDIYPDGHGIWLDGGEIDKLRNRKLVKFVKSVKFAFSEKGF